MIPRASDRARAPISCSVSRSRADRSATNASSRSPSPSGGTRFTFTFRARYGLRAQSAPSVLYDYYNPEARAVVAPVRFNVTEQTRAVKAQR